MSTTEPVPTSNEAMRKRALLSSAAPSLEGARFEPEWIETSLPCTRVSVSSIEQEDEVQP